MGEIRYSPRQQQAIDHRGQDILVSAAAGSGKTSVLSARIAALIEEGADIRRMLIVTFTTKAAAEMRSRIRRGLEEYARAKGDPRLAMQAEQTDSADICTIHSFASKVIKENFAQLGLSADVHAAGDEQMQIFQAEALEQLLQEMYAQEDAQFIKLRDRYSGRDDVAISAQIFNVYAYCMSQPEGVEWILRGGMPNTDAYMQVVREQTLAGLGRLQDVLQECITLEKDWAFPEKQHANNLLDVAMAQQLQQAYLTDQQVYGKLLQAAKIPALVRLPKGEQSSQGRELLQVYKKRARALLKQLAAAQPGQAAQRIQQELPYLQEMIQALYRAVRRFDEIYTQIKREHRAIDYDDMLRLAYQVLQDPQTARSTGARYDYIFIDEYQDTNPLQEALLSSLQPRGGRFMVGDMKQSIYRFRLTDPLIFRNKAQAGSGVHVIHMNDNYRCGDGIIDVVNYTMGKLMSPHLGEIQYDAGEQLIQGRALEGKAEILLSRPEEDSDAAEMAAYEARSIAERIHALLQERKADGTPRYTQSDICILLRNMEGYANIYASILAEEGIDVKISGSTGSFPAAGEMFLNLLRVIDGFTSDIALMSVMKSFMGGFVDAELAYIRGEVKAESFAESLLGYSAGEDALAQRCRAFLSKIEMYRDWAQAMTPEELLIRLKIEEDYEAHLLAMPGGEEKHKTFTDLFAKLKEWAADKASLYELLGYVRQVNALGALQRGRSESVGAVHIMSIHGSKGLEFPVVIMARMHSQFSNRDKSAPFLLHNRLGISMDMVDEKRRIKKDSWIHQLAQYELEKEQKSEELRVLYVAMTRAKERLILSAAVKDAEAWMHKLGSIKWYDLLDMHNMFEWVMSAVIALPCMAQWRGAGKRGEAEGPEILLRLVSGEHALRHRQVQEVTQQHVLDQVSRLARVDFLQYQNKGVPVKIGVSTLLPQDEQGAYVPAYQGGDAGAELGTLIHLFMQHLDFAIQTEAQLAQLGALLLEKQIITQAELRRIRPFFGRILKFLQSDIAGRARAAGNMRREIPFSLMVSARELGLGDSDERVMMQGIIDMAFLEGDEYIIVDYKSNMADEVRLLQLAEHYGLQMKLYRMALEKITGKKVAQCCLWFLRQEREFAIY